VENPYFQYFCGEEFFQHQRVFDRSSLTRWRQRMGEEKLLALLQESLATATRTGAIKPSDLARMVVDTTVQPKAVMFPTDAKLVNRARERLVRQAKQCGVTLRQSYARVGKLALIKHQRYAHAKQFKRANRSLRKLRTWLGRVVRDIRRKTAATADLREAFVRPLYLAELGALAASSSARTQSLFAARAGGGMHRQGQGAQALRVRRQSERRHHREAFRRRPIRHPCGGAAGQPL
jgi:IS5 family transposase